uniref:Uncharacterized protein n=1 Tax=Octopus bimaculoides TaxID=37653 RepID=A0A0L8FPY6_OCTBM
MSKARREAVYGPGQQNVSWRVMDNFSQYYSFFGTLEFMTEEMFEKHDDCTLLQFKVVLQHTGLFQTVEEFNRIRNSVVLIDNFVDRFINVATSILQSVSLVFFP